MMPPALMTLIYAAKTLDVFGRVASTQNALTWMAFSGLILRGGVFQEAQNRPARAHYSHANPRCQPRFRKTIGFRKPLRERNAALCLSLQFRASARDRE